LFSVIGYKQQCCADCSVLICVAQICRSHIKLRFSSTLCFWV